MLEKIIRLYNCYMMQDVRSPIPHLAGPPGVGKSTVVEEFCRLMGVNLHIINVARINILEIEGVQMPVEGNTKLELLLSTVWNNLQEGDVVLLDEFMRGFPEVYNGLLDIMTSRQVAGHKLPKVFFIGASNSVATYDPALEDRLLHIFVPDIRKSGAARKAAKRRFIEELGLNPDLMNYDEFDNMLTEEVYPMYDVLDQFQHKASIGSASKGGSSLRKLAGQVQLREVQSKTLKELIELNNLISLQKDYAQFVILLSGQNPNPNYVRLAKGLRGNPKLTEVQATNLELNLQLIEMETAIKETITTEGEAVDPDIF